MKISYNWLKKYIDVPYSPGELVEKLTMLGIEVESVDHIGNIPDGIIVGEIIKREPHPDADKLSVCEVFTGKETLKIVCGAQNCNPGVKAPVAMIGTELAGKDGVPMKIRKAKLRGVESFGMLCSEIELGLSENHSGIMELPTEIPAGTPFSEVVRPDTIYDLEITSNRPDWLSFIGVAREIRAVSGREIMYPEANIREPSGISACNGLVEVHDFSKCPRYTARIIRGVSVKESPDWLKKSLMSIGLRPINNIVDISNFVLFELGQPLHVFDLDNLAENRIVVRNAYEREEIVCLDGSKHQLKSGHLVIADAVKPVAVAGIMGGELSGVSEKTRNVLIESAYFSPQSIKKTSRELGLSSDSSHRFERGVDPQTAVIASNRAAELILELAGGEICSCLEMKEDTAFVPVPKTVQCRFDAIRSRLGISVTNREMTGIFRLLGLNILNETETSCDVVSTSYRLDIEQEADLSEEVLRVYGISRVPVGDVVFRSSASFRNDKYSRTEKAVGELTALGLTECVTYSMTDKKALLKTGLYREADLLEVVNPVSAETSALRPTLFIGMLKVLARNVSFFNYNLRLFELGKIYTSDKKHPEERLSCCIILTGLKHAEMYADEKKEAMDFFDLKGLIETWLDGRRVDGYSCERSDYPVFKPECRAEYKLNGGTVAYLGEISDDYTKGMRLKYPVYGALIEMNQILTIDQGVCMYKPFPVYPSVSRDVAMVVNDDIDNSVIVGCIEAAGCELLESVEVFDVYKDKSLTDAGKKSMAYSLTYRNHQRTMTDEEVNLAHEKIRERLVKTLNVELR